MYNCQLLEAQLNLDEREHFYKLHRHLFCSAQLCTTHFHFETLSNKENLPK